MLRVTETRTPEDTCDACSARVRTNVSALIQLDVWEEKTKVPGDCIALCSTCWAQAIQKVKGTKEMKAYKAYMKARVVKNDT